MKPLRKIRPELKRALIEEAGNKCANPGCSNWKVHIHHIKHWAVYKAHDADHMIAVCPGRHDDIHRGQIPISDATLYEWKSISRPLSPDHLLISVEPAAPEEDLKLLAGSIALATSNDKLTVFELSNSNRLSLRILDRDILQVTIKLVDLNGHEMLRVVENNVRINKDKRIDFSFRQGRALVTMPADGSYVPKYLVDRMREFVLPDFAPDGRVVALDLEVLKPGLVKIYGCWYGPDGSVVITEKGITFMRAIGNPTTLAGLGELTTLKAFKGSLITKAMFGFAP